MPYNEEFESKKMRDSGMSERDIALTSMKQSKKEMEKPATVRSAEEMDDEHYPYGLKLDFDTETLEKLGVKDLKDVGEYCYIHAVGKVTSISESQDEYADGARRSMCVQITKMSVEDYEMDDED